MITAVKGQWYNVTCFVPYPRLTDVETKSSKRQRTKEQRAKERKKNLRKEQRRSLKGSDLDKIHIKFLRSMISRRSITHPVENSGNVSDQ